MEFLAFKNGLRLHFDSIKLHTIKSYPSALALSILAMEEFGKAGAIGDFIFYDQDVRTPKELEEEWFGLLYRHDWKQDSFKRYDTLHDWMGYWLHKHKKQKSLESIKQNAVYVGLDRKNRRIDFNGKIKHPFQITSTQSGSNITLVNDFLIDLTMGVIHTYYGWDNEAVSKLMNRKLLSRLNENWKHKSHRMKQKIIRTEKWVANGYKHR